MTTEAKLEKLPSKELLAEKSMVRWRAPLKEHVLPRASGGEIILFKSFIEGTSFTHFQVLSISAVFLQIDYEPSDPNGVLSISIFVHIYEAFLGICPSINLFWYFFWVKCQPSDMAVHVVGGAGIQLMIETKKEYLEYNLLESVRN